MAETTITGKSEVAINEQVFKTVVEGLSRDKKVTVKLDARKQVRTYLGKVKVADNFPIAITLYTGAIENLWDTVFASESLITTDVDALMFVTVYLVNKGLKGDSFDYAVKESSNIAVEDDYKKILGVIDNVLKIYMKLDEDASNHKVVKAKNKPKKKIKQAEEIEGCKGFGLKQDAEDVKIFEWAHDIV